MKKQLAVTITPGPEEDFFQVESNKNLIFLINSCNEFYLRIISTLRQHYQKTYEISYDINELINRFILEKKTQTVEVTKGELIWLTNWIDVVCIMLIEMDNVDFKNKEVKRFLKLAQNFIDKTKELVPEYEPQKNAELNETSY